jgi:hypothetical protein
VKEVNWIREEEKPVSLGGGDAERVEGCLALQHPEAIHESLIIHDLLPAQRIMITITRIRGGHDGGASITG